MDDLNWIFDSDKLKTNSEYWNGSNWLPIDDAGNPIEPAKWKEDLINKISSMTFNNDILQKWLQDLPEDQRTQGAMKELLLDSFDQIFKVEPE